MTAAPSSPRPRVIRVGVVGCGEVAQVSKARVQRGISAVDLTQHGVAVQTTHLLTLQLLSDLYRVTALCDLSPTLLNHCGRKYSIERCYSD